MNANNSVIKILAEALEKGISVFLDGDSLKLKVAKNQKVDPEFIKFIKGYKEEITQFLYSQREIAQEQKSTQPIVPIDRSAYNKLPLSFSQERLWFIDKLDGSLAYNMPSVLKLKGEINIEVLEYAFNAIVNRHEVLRTVYQAEEGQPFQVVLPKDQWTLKVTDLTQNDDEDLVDELIDAEIKQAFDLANDYMLRANLLKLCDDEFVLIMVIHHIASDGWSNPILVNEIVSCYKSKIDGNPAGLPELPIQYIDYAVWQKEYLTGEVLNGKLSYWEEKLKGTEPINLPTDFVRPAIQSTKGSTIGLTIDQKISEQIAELAKETGTTLSMILLSVLKILLSRYSGQNDICVGMPIANRSASEVESLIGFFVNTLALRTNLNTDQSFADLILEMKQTMLDAFNHQDVPFEKIVDRVENGRDMSRNPVFQVAYTFNNTEDIPNLDLGNATLEMMPFTDETTPYDLSWDLMSTAEGIQIDVQYCTDLFKEETVQRMLAHFGQLLASAVSNANQPIDCLNMLLQEEEALILGQKATENGEWFNQPAKDLNNTLPINVRFEQYAADCSESTAVIHGDIRWSYQQVNEFANQLAHSLSSMGVQAGDFVGVYAERNPDLLSALLGIIKIGAVYVPLDTQNPIERIEKMIANSEMAAIISTDALVAQLQVLSTDKVLLFDNASAPLQQRMEAKNGQLLNRTELENASTENPTNQNQMNSWAYMLFTSGSTGEPKGAITRHDGAMNHILAEYELLQLADGFNFLQSAGIGSDISLWQMLAPVLKGGSVVIVDKFDILNYDAIIQLMTDEQISIVEFVPSYIWGLVERLKEMPNRPALNDLKWIMMVGEQVPVKLVNDFRDLYPHVRILNGYGPCEASDDITQYEVIGKLDPKLTRVPIGRSLTNMNMFVVNSNGALCPIGIAGELCVSGVGVGAGYLGMPEKTAAAFIKNPFPGTLGDTLYRTGDLGRWLPDGNLEFLGRIDRQVKIRGHRVELGEIETYIREDKMVKDAHIMVHRGEEEGAQDALAAFVVVDENQGKENRVLGKELLNKVDQKIEAHNENNPHLTDQLIELEKGIKAYALNKSESLFAYNEIFEEQAYLINGISLKPGDVVFDVGANVGMFSMYVSLHFPGSEIYAFEPLPPTYEIMNSNCIIYGDQANIKAYKAGLSDKNQKVTFTHYPDNSMLSGRYGDLEEDKSYVRNVLERQLRDEDNQDADIQILVDKTMNYEEYECQLLSLSEVVEENNIQQIDLLKVDVERSELDVLMGIKPEHWSRIKQIVIEVHDDGNSLDKVKEFLDTYGYNYLVEQEDLLVGTHLYNIYAIRKDVADSEAATNVTPDLIGLDMISKALFTHCQDGLPAYMQPTEYYFVEKIPLNLSDKVDQKQLKAILELEKERSSGQTNFKDGKPCTTETEKSILAIWEAILDRKGIGADEDFFEAGGHSLLAMRVKAALQKEMDVEIDIRDLFLYKSIEQLANYIETREVTNTQPALVLQERPERIPLSFAQERLWFIDKLEGSVHYQIPLALRLTGDLDSTILEYAIQQIINRHEILRTVYKEKDGIGAQEILAPNSWTLQLKDAPELKEQEQLLTYIERETAQAFDLSNDHMIRAQLLKIDENNHVLVFVLHHIAFDGWSESIIVNEFKEFYTAKLENRTAQLETLPIQYADYALWQKNYLNEEVLDEKLNYWEDKLAGVEPLNLPLDFTRPSVQSTKGKSVQYKIDLDVKQQLEALSKNEGATMYMTLVSAFKVMLHRYTGQTDICIASPSANRMQEEVADMIGFFLNTIVLRNDLTNNPSFRELLGRVKLNSLEAYSHQDVPFEKIIDRVVKVRDMSRNALAEVVFVHQHIPDQSIGQIGQLKLEEIEFNLEQSYADIHFTVIETDEGLEVLVNYCTALFKEETIQRLIMHYETLLRSIIQNPVQHIGQLNMLTEAEQNQLIFAHNDNGEQFPKSATLVNLFEKQVAQFPDATALVFENQSISYKELNQQANKLARHLRDDMGIQPNDLVGVMMERSAWSVISILGILKAGAAYVPIDNDYPMDRKAYIVEDTQLKALIIQSENLFDVLEFQVSIFSIDIQLNELEVAEENLDIDIAQNDLAYVIYTSGSTGKPKGVMIEHGSIKNTVFAQIDGFDIEAGDHCLQFASFSFDASVSETFTALCAGASLYVVSKVVRSNPMQFIKYMNDHTVQVATIPPAYLDQLHVDQLTSLKTLVTAGESAVYEKAEAFLQHGTYLNAYGPTEASICATMYKVQKGQALTAEKTTVVPIGQAIANAQIYLIDKNEELVPVGVVGELCIGGDGLARGYLNRPELTEEKFIANKFNPAKSSRIYKTGDLARWLPNGNIEFLGRVDHQVKIRGFRIELEEVEAVLQQAPGVQQCVVVTKGDSIDTKKLVAYVVSEGEYDRKTIQSYLKNQLPDYMVPSQMMNLDALPMTINGKVDKKALPEPEATDLVNGEFEAPSTETELAIDKIWQELLNIDQIGVNDNFFDLGGHSLLAARVVAALQQDLGLQVALYDVFSYPTIAQLAVFVDQLDPAQMDLRITAGERPERIPLSYAQERLWFIDKLEGSLQYHMPAVLRFKGDLNISALEDAITTIVNRHEAVRTVFEEIEGKAYQKVMPENQWQLAYTPLNDFTGNRDALIAAEIERPFDLSSDHMLRAHLLQTAEEDYLLIFVMHHIASDGWSMSILVDELMANYSAAVEGTSAELPELTIQYADYALWQRATLNGEAMESKLSYWKRTLADIEPLNLPTDYTRPAIQSTKGQTLTMNFDADVAEALNAIAKEEGITLFMVLLSAIKVLMYKYSGQVDICIGTPIANRPQKETEALIGYFLNTLALRSDLSGNPTFSNLLSQVKNNSLDAFDNQEIPFEKIVDLVETGRDQSRSPIFQVMFVLQNTPEIATLKLGDAEISSVAFEDQTALFDLTFNMEETENGLDLQLVYCKDLFAETSIQNMMEHFNVLLHAIAENRMENIDQLPILTQSEEVQLQSFLNAPVGYPKDKTIVKLFEDQAALRPDNTALSFAGESMTYAELNEKANRFAAYLIQQGVQVEDLVTICLNPSFDMIVSILGIIKAGGAYVPIDPDYPQDRINYIIEDAQASFIVSESVHADLFVEHPNCQPIFIDEQAEAIAQCPGHNVEVDLKPENLIYVIYTSGSTGKPKGVLLEHRNLVRLFVNDEALFDFNETDVWTMFHSFCFDFSVWEMYGALLFGGQLLVVPKEVRKDTNAYAELLYNNGVTVLNQTPGAFNILQESYLGAFDKTNIRYVIFGGEALNPTQLQNWNEAFPTCQLINMYGITETTVHVTYKALVAEDLRSSCSNIGRAIPTLDTYVLDTAGNLCPVGVSGELYVTGDGLARGYLNRPELTADRFIEKANGQRLYRTGDLAKWSNSGELEYLGRIDHQVKIRGFRIELGEIEAVLLQADEVSQGVVIAHTNANGNKRLVAYVVPEGSFNREAILENLYSQLPDYMVPSIIVELDQMPLTVNGKINKKALPEPDVTGALTAEFIAPRSDFEKTIAEIWSGLLNVETVGIHDNFFELGGDSIITIQVISRAKRAGITLKPRDLFQYQTIAELSKFVQQNNWTIQAEQGPLTGEAPLLPIQKWFFENGTALNHYNQAELLELSKSIDADTLEEVINAVVNQHDALGFTYQNSENWTQTYANAKEVFVTVDLSKVTKKKLAASITDVCREYQQSLQIEKGELMKAVWIKTPKSVNNNRLFIVIHHLAVDGVSWRILVEQMELALAALQNGGKIDLGTKSSSYREWANALTAFAQTPKVLDQLPYWESIAKNYQPLSIDFAEANTLAKDIKHIAVDLDEALTQSLLQQVNQAYNTEINDILLAALAKTLNDWSGREKIVIGLEGHGREDLFKELDTSNTIGWFTNLYPVALESAEASSASALIKNIKEQLRAVPGKGMGYGLLRYLNQDESIRERLANTQWDVVFNYLGQIDNLVNENSTFQAASEDAGNPLSDNYAFDARMDISGVIAKGRLSLNWTYSEQQYSAETINNLANAYLQNLKELIEHCVAKETTERTASDYGLAPMVNTSSLDAFLNSDWNGKALKDQISSVYALSPVQEGMLFHGLYDKKSNAYVVQHQFHLPDGLDLEAFKAAFESVIDQHSILRTGFFHDQLSIPVQCVFNNIELPFEVQDYTMLSGAALTREIDLFMQADRQKGFDFTAAPLMRMTFIKIDDEAYKMVWTCHHILFDGWSMPIIMQELLSAYETIVQGNTPALQSDDLFEDYIRYINSKEEAEEKAFWTDYLSSFESPSLIPFVSNKLERNKGKGKLSKESLLFDETYTAKIRQFAQDNHITVNTLVQGVWSLLLSKYTGSDTATFGVTVSGRPADLTNAEHRVGVFINTLPLHTSTNADEVVLDWLTQIQNGHTAAREFQYTAQSNIQTWSGAKGDFFDSILVFENYPIDEALNSKQVVNIEMETAIDETNYLMTVMIDLTNTLNVTFNYYSELLGEEYVTLIKGHFAQAIDQIVDRNKATLAEIQLLTPMECKMLEEFNNTFVDYPTDVTIVDLFEKQAQETPDAIALTFAGEDMTFQELNEKSNQLAHYLRAKGVKEESLVAICVDRSFDMIVGLMGILKAGGAYVPIDPDYPSDRIDYIIENANAKFALSHHGYDCLFDNCEALESIRLDKDWEAIAQESVEKVANDLQPDNLMYVIYTSGSTGKPKGVMNQHSGLVNRLLWTQGEYQLVAGEDTILQKTTFCFDVSVWELFWPLISGVRMVIAKPGGHKDSDYLRKVIDETGVTTMHFVPSMLEVFLLDVEPGVAKSLRRVLCSGEALKPSHVAAFREKLRHVELHNLYGPTEAAIDVTYWAVPNAPVDKVPIGRPVANTQLYILDESGANTGIGVPGELYLGGIQVARGYYNRPELTAERFIDDPCAIEEGTKLYKTGDLARWMPDGNVEYLGRIDHQVKIRGNRIELGEIETVIQLSPYATQCVVMAKPDPTGNLRLVAYIVPEGEFDKEAIQNFIRTKLPTYMVPSVMLSLEAMPLTPNGKVNRKALPEPNISDLQSNEYIAPRNTTELAIAQIWKELLKVEQVGINDNFFDLGGHSILATRTVSAIRKQLEVEIAIKDIFTYSTVALLSEHLDVEGQAVLLPSIEAVERPERIPLSFSQERLWFLDKLSGSVQYHLPGVLKVTGDLDVQSLEEAFRDVVNRHEVLRTVCREEEGVSYQEVLAENLWAMDAEVEQIITDETTINNIIESVINKPFDLSNDHMLRAQVVKTGEAEHLLIFVMHHIASDGWSISLFIDELSEYYLAKKENRTPVLKTMPIQYADYAMWQRNYLEGEVLDNKLNYWTEKLQAVEPLNLPTDFSRPPIQSSKGSSLSFTVDAQLTSKLNALSRSEEATLYMLLLSAFKVMLQKYSGQEDITVGCPIANRMQAETEAVIGYFVNTLALRSDLSDDPKFTDLLAQVKATTLDAYANQEVPFEKIVDKVSKERDRSRNPIFQVMLTLHNNPNAVEVDLKEAQLSSVSYERTTSQFDLSFDMIETAKGLEVEIIYCTDLFAEASIKRMKQHFQKLLEAIVAQPEANIETLTMITEAEKTLLLEEFNATAVDYPTDETIVSLFEQQVAQSPEATALYFEGKEMSFQELNDKSNQLAHYLRKKGVKEEKLVAICVDRSFDMIVGLMGILKAGGAYVPIDPDYPQDRIDYIIENANANFAISHNGYDQLFERCEGIENVQLDKDWTLIAEESVAQVVNDLTPDNLMYVIYTSGSTGKPKGVMNQHSGLVNRLLWTQSEYNLIAGEDAILQKTTFCFDVSVWELFWPLISGIRMVIAKPGGHKDSDYLRDIIDEAKVTTMHFVPSMLEVFLLDVEVGVCNSLRRVLCSGEALKPNHVAEFKHKLNHVELHNLYGPTEAAIDVTYWAIPANKVEKVPIGKPVANTQLYILNKAGKLTALGVPGELYLAGVQVARGYYNRPDLTEERFVLNPFSETDHGKMYKTGDLARWLPDGNIEYLGRIDNQVKIRGNRIELGEIELVMQQSPMVNQCVVLAKPDVHGNKRLVAYVVSEADYDKEAVQTFLKKQVPEYMVPGILIEIPEVPLTPNGKIDRKALPEPEESNLSSTEYVAPRDEMEEQLANIWKKLLNVEQVGIHDNFFELGGDSIITIQAVSRAKRLGYTLKPRNMFDHQTVATLAAFIRANTATEVETEQGLLEGEAALMPMQHLFFEHDFDGMAHYNFSDLMKVDKSVELEHLDTAIKAIVAQHDALRFKYHKLDGQWTQTYGDYEGGVDVIDLTAVAEEDLQAAIEKACVRVHESLDLEKGELIRVALMKTPEFESHHRFMIVAHHLGIDGVSWRILFEDFNRAMKNLADGEAIDFGEKTSSFRQWSAAMSDYATSEKVTAEYDYWLKAIQGYQALPVDHEVTEQPLMKDHHGNRKTLSKALTESLLREVHGTYNTKIDDLLLAALAMTINQWGGLDKVLVGMEGHGREDLFSELNVTKTMGWFTSIYPVLFDVEDPNNIGNLIKGVKERMRNIPQKGIGYGLLRFMHPSEEMSSNLSEAKWDILFNYLGQMDGTASAGEAMFSGAEEYSGADTSENYPFTSKLEINGSIFQGELSIMTRYSRKLYDDATIDSLLEQYIENLEAIIKHCLETNDVQATPADFGLNGKVSYQEMDEFLNEHTDGESEDDEDDVLLKF